METKFDKVLTLISDLIDNETLILMGLIIYLFTREQYTEGIVGALIMYITGQNKK